MPWPIWESVSQTMLRPSLLPPIAVKISTILGINSTLNLWHFSLRTGIFGQSKGHLGLGMVSFNSLYHPAIIPINSRISNFGPTFPKTWIYTQRRYRANELAMYLLIKLFIKLSSIIIIIVFKWKGSIKIKTKLKYQSRSVKYKKKTKFTWFYHQKKRFQGCTSSKLTEQNKNLNILPHFIAQWALLISQLTILLD